MAETFITKIDLSNWLDAAIGLRFELNPDYAIANLLRAEIAANTDFSSHFLLTVGFTTILKKMLAGKPVFFALSTLVTISIAQSGLNGGQGSSTNAKKAATGVTAFV
jgi:hypothetical protein